MPEAPYYSVVHLHRLLCKDSDLGQEVALGMLHGGHSQLMGDRGVCRTDFVGRSLRMERYQELSRDIYSVVASVSSLEDSSIWMDRIYHPFRLAVVVVLVSYAEHRHTRLLFRCQDI
jgi:hypothetical protein